MLNTMSSAHNKIFGAKFLSFEHLETMCLYTVSYVIFGRSAMKSDSQMSYFCLSWRHFYTPIVPLLSCNSATFTL